MGTLDVQEPSLKNLTEDNFGKPKTHQHETLQNLLKPHVESFNYMLRDGLRLAVQSIIPIEFQLPNGQIVSLQVDDANIHAPCIKSTANAKTAAVYPAECRQRGTTYKGRISMHLRVTVDKQRVSLDERQLGEVPIMVKSSRCNLHKLKPAALVRRGEEDEEMGGYFVINGNEKVVRMIIMPRRNYPVAIARPTWKNRGSYYTEYGVQIRCVTKDQTSTNNVIHYLSNGTAIMAFVYNKETFFVPVVMILKCLVGLPDQHIFQKLIQGYENNSFYKNCIANMLRMAQAEGLAKREDVLKYIGERFRIKLHTPAWYTDEQVTLFLLRYMTRKLFSFAAGESAAESADNPMFQEILLPGHLYQMVIKDKIENWLNGLRIQILRLAAKKHDFQLKTESVNDACKRAGNITRPMEYFLATGNVISKSGLGLMQAAGFAVVADKLNFYRYLSHFRAVHRGAFFTEMRTTSVRKLLPEAWGFMCPVHTPDGAPCGLLNHMSAFCHVVNKETSSTHLPNLLRELGMETVDLAAPSAADHCYEVLLNGKVLGWIDDELVQSVADQLRKMKVLELNQVSKFTEICLVHKTDVASQYPGLYIFTNVARMMRPVVSLVHQTREYLGTFEQVYLNISVVAEETITAVTTHQEISEIAMLSAIASLTPFSDFNQSPRNMYQCQMGKQTMGTPLHAYMYRADNKLYRIQTPQVPLVRPAMHDYYNIDNYPLGTNAVVAVISYTGYDMEDAMILNKGSFERGFGHGSVYKSDVIDLHRVDGSHGRTPLVFASKPGDHKRRDLDDDGLPPVGRLLVEGDPYYSYLNVQTGEYTVKTYRSAEPAYLEQVKMLGDDSGSEPSQKVCLFLRVERNPIIGDKFSSRHGQKGICSQKWPVPNMPFTESGMTPDILFNPHGFPSRMTIGMMIESMAGKSAAMHGLCHDATPFTFSEDNPAIDYFGRCLREAGYNYYGTERMYSGISGLELEADIFVGIVYYQRLRHMVSDKFQVRTTGPVDQLTHQPVKGRKRHGGIRFGEMERDAMLSHGTSFLLQDRLFNCSDRDLGHVCRTCGSLMSTSLSAPSPLHTAAVEDSRVWKCSVCGPQGQVEVIELPYVFRYLAAELAAMNIKIKLDIKSTCM